MRIPNLQVHLPCYFSPSQCVNLKFFEYKEDHHELFCQNPNFRFLWNLFPAEYVYHQPGVSPKLHVSLDFNPFDNTIRSPMIRPLSSVVLLVDEPRPTWKRIGKYNLRALDCLAKALLSAVDIP